MMEPTPTPAATKAAKQYAWHCNTPGGLAAAFDAFASRRVAAFAETILHGDDEHRAWLKEAAEAFVAGKQAPAPRSRVAEKDAEIATLKTEISEQARYYEGVVGETEAEIVALRAKVEHYEAPQHLSQHERAMAVVWEVRAYADLLEPGNIGFHAIRRALAALDTAEVEKR